ncbi:hypothetical protein AN958_09596 [Leucoagaricus sp. SymC.cos]|nr:hypothetical protein AN958_09596 [Leucoagaricus sp. SymC.cos]
MYSSPSHQRRPTRRTDSDASEILLQHTLLDTEFDSPARGPLPQCYPGTRTAIRRAVSSRLDDLRPGWNVIWLYGPAEVGKTVIAQAIAEDSYSAGRLGASVFLSHANLDGDSHRLLPTIAQRLMSQNWEYKQLVAKELYDNPLLPEADLRTQFKCFITVPLDVLQARHAGYEQRPQAVILDGLDDWAEEENQRLFLELVCLHTRFGNQSSLLWLIFSRFHPIFEATFLKFAPKHKFRKEEILVSKDARDDIYSYLCDNFQSLHAQYRDILRIGPKEHWPSPAQRLLIADSVAGDFAFASALLNYLGNVGTSNPVTRLASCLEFLVTSDLESIEPSPVQRLDLLYMHILSTIPHDTLTIALRILSFCAYHPRHPLSALELSNFLCLDQDTFYGALHELQPIVFVPGPKEAITDRLRFYNKSFGTFILDPSRSGNLHIKAPAIHMDVAVCSLRWRAWSLRCQCATSNKEENCCLITNPLEQLQWVPDNPDVVQDCMTVIEDYASSMCWEAVYEGTTEDSVPVYDEICKLAYCPDDHLVGFIKVIIRKYSERQAEEDHRAVVRIKMILNYALAFLSLVVFALFLFRMIQMKLRD